VQRIRLRTSIVSREAHEVPGHAAALRFREAATDPKVHEPERRVGPNKHVSRVQIAVEEAMQKCRAQNPADREREQPLTVRPIARCQRRAVIRHTLDVSHDKDALADHAIDGYRNADEVHPTRLVYSGALANVERLQAEVGVFERQLREQLDEARQVRSREILVETLGRGCGERQRADVGPKPSCHSGATHLHCHGGPSESAARCTWAIDPAASGSGSRSANRSNPISRSRIERTGP
jgi:hypothetical protein